jgi:hypothetical protein
VTSRARRRTSRRWRGRRWRRRSREARRGTGRRWTPCDSLKHVDQRPDFCKYFVCKK